MNAADSPLICDMECDSGGKLDALTIGWRKASSPSD